MILIMLTKRYHLKLKTLLQRLRTCSIQLRKLCLIFFQKAKLELISMPLDLRKQFQSIQVTQSLMNKLKWHSDSFHKANKAYPIKILNKASTGLSQPVQIGRLVASEPLENGCSNILFHQRQLLITCFKKLIEFCKRG